MWVVSCSSMTICSQGVKNYSRGAAAAVGAYRMRGLAESEACLVATPVRCDQPPKSKID